MSSSSPQRHQGTQLSASGVAVPVHAPAGQPAQFTQRPPEHCESPVHQHGTPALLHVPLGEATLSQVPAEQDQALAADVMSAQSTASYAPVIVEPVQMLLPHCEVTFEHLLLGQSVSATQRQAVCALLHAGAGESEVVHV
jgi:hypothetical protein